MMLTRADGSPVRSKRLAGLESSWNNNMQPSNQPRRHMQMTKDIKKFILQSIDGDIHQAQRVAAAKPKHVDHLDIFGKISSTFNFTHHEGTDPKAEMKVVKIILVREGQIMSLQHLSDKASKAENITGACGSILEVLAEIRESSLNYLEALCLWRQTVPNGNTMSPRIFFWEKKNYTLKLISDLDFLADNLRVIEALSITPEQFRSNPLMLTNNLDDPSTWMDPVERAGQDAGGITQGPVFESRLRLRFAERILLQELELTSNPSVAGDSGTFLTEPERQQPQGYGQFNTKYQPLYQQEQKQQPPSKSPGNAKGKQNQKQSKQALAKGSSALEAEDYYDDEDSYLRKEEGLQPGGLADKSLWGVPDMLRESGDKSRSNSGDSESAVRPSLPNSRSSSINNGMSAPNSSQGSRSHTLNSLRVPANKSMSGNTGIGAGNTGFEYGHDFFTGHWAESKPFVGSYDASVESSKANTGRDESGGIFFMDGNTAMDGAGQRQPQRRAAPVVDTGDDISVHSTHSMQSIDSVASGEVHVLANVREPSRNLVLAATACMILLAPGPEIPTDVSWNAFLKLCLKVDVSTLLRNLDPQKVHKFKVLAIGPLLEQMVDEFTYDGIMHSSVPFHEYTAANKLVTWVQQFTAHAIAKKNHKKVKAILSPGPGTAKQRQRAAAGSNGVAPGTLHGSNELHLGPLPKAKRTIPSASLQLAPIYSEMDSTLYKQPILIALLSAYERKGTGRTKWKPRPPRSSKHIEEEDVGEFDRLVVKVYDVTGSAEFQHTVIIREYELLLADLEDAYHDRAHVYFQPTNPAWWATFIKSVLVIQSKPDGTMKLSISKKAIEQLVADGVEQAAAPPVLLRLQPKPEPAPLVPPTSLASPVNATGASPPRKSKPAAVTAPTAASNLAKPPLSKKTQPEAHLSAKAKSTPTAPVSVKAAAPRTPEAEGKVKQSKVSAKIADAAAASSKGAAAPARSASPASSAVNKPVASKPRAAASTSSKEPSASAKAVVKTVPASGSGAPAAGASAKAPTGSAKTPVAAAADLPVVVTPQAPAPAPATAPVSVVAAASETAKTAPAEAELDYNEDFETGSLAERLEATVAASAVPSGDAETAIPQVKPGIAGADYDEDFEEENSAGGTAATAEDANTANAVLSAADTYSLQDQTTPGGVVEVREGDNRYYSDFEENSLDNASGAMLDEASYTEADARAPSERVQLNEDPNRPLSAIEQAQREFDEIGEDDGVFFNSVDYDEDF